MAPWTAVDWDGPTPWVARSPTHHHALPLHRSSYTHRLPPHPPFNYRNFTYRYLIHHSIGLWRS